MADRARGVALLGIRELHRNGALAQRTASFGMVLRPGVGHVNRDFPGLLLGRRRLFLLGIACLRRNRKRQEYNEQC